MDVDKFRAMFLDEADDHVRTMVEVLLKLDNDPDNLDDIDALFREAHSIKGMAATMEYHETARLAHHLEDHLEQCRLRKRIRKEEIDRFIEATDLLEALLNDISEKKSERDVDGFISAALRRAEELNAEGSVSERDNILSDQAIQLRLTLKSTTAASEVRLLILLKWLSEQGTVLEAEPTEEQLLTGEGKDCLTVRLLTEMTKQDLSEQLQQFKELEDIRFLEGEDPSSRAPDSSRRTVRVNTELLDHFINLTGELITNRYRLQNAAKERHWGDLDEAVGQLNRLVKTLHHQVLQVRMVALDSLTGRIRRTLHDLCRSSGKDVQINFSGMELELDRAIVEGLVDPLGHMIRNAVDHGIAEQGAIDIKAWRERDQVLLQVADDGRGMDPEDIRRNVIERELLTPNQAEKMRDYDLFQMICRPGFSTTTEVTATSGRGVGMDVVKTAVEKLGGVLTVDSVVGEGTRITLKMPLSLSIIRALLVECADMTMAMPITRVNQTLELRPEDIQSSGKQLMIRHQNELLPLLSLRKILAQPKGSAGGLVSVVLTDVLARRVGLVVDKLVRQQEIFVQRLPQPFDQVRGCAGGTILGDGRIVFLLDLQSLLEKRRM